MDFCESSAEFFDVASLALDTLSGLRSNKLKAEHKAPCHDFFFYARGIVNGKFIFMASFLSDKFLSSSSGF